MPIMKITRQFILENRTPRGAWTRLQIEALGIEWPPQQGWIEAAIGRELTADQVHQFKTCKTSIKRMGAPIVGVSAASEATTEELLNSMAAIVAELLKRQGRTSSPAPDAANLEVARLAPPQVAGQHGGARPQSQGPHDDSPPWD
jgi:hypothetical protein